MSPPLRSVAVLGAHPADTHALLEDLRGALAPHAGLHLTDQMPAPASAACTLLLALPPCEAGQPGPAPAQLEQDQRLRQQLLQAGRPHHIVHGHDRATRLLQALHALGLSPAGNASTLLREQAQFDLQGGRLRWSCEKCSDPECEHRLFTGLLRSRDAGRPVSAASRPLAAPAPPR